MSETQQMYKLISRDGLEGPMQPRTSDSSSIIKPLKQRKSGWLGNVDIRSVEMFERREYRFKKRILIEVWVYEEE